jgi:hypothetical protein
MVLLILILILIFGFGGGYVGNRFNEGYGPPFGIGAVLVVLLILYLLGYLHK